MVEFNNLIVYIIVFPKLKMYTLKGKEEKEKKKKSRQYLGTHYMSV